MSVIAALLKGISRSVHSAADRDDVTAHKSIAQLNEFTQLL